MDAVVIFSAVAIAAGVEFSTMEPGGERAVSELATFFQELFVENARSQDADVHLLCTRSDAIANFLRSWLAPHLPKA